MSVRASRPHDNLCLSFILTFKAILDNDEPPPFFTPPVPLDGLDADAAAYFARHNPLAESIQAGIRSDIIAELVAGGMPSERLAEPMTTETAALVASMARDRQVAMHTAWEAATGRLSPSRPIPSEKVILASLAENLIQQFPEWRRNRVYTIAARLLSHGVPAGNSDATSGNRERVDDDHVRRAHNSFLPDLMTRGNRRAAFIPKDFALTAVAAFVLEWRLAVDAMLIIYEEAQKNPAFSRLKGRSLADAVADRYDPFTCFAKARAIAEHCRTRGRPYFRLEEASGNTLTARRVATPTRALHPVRSVARIAQTARA